MFLSCHWQARDANASPGNAALARRREELLLELQVERIRQDMILRELAETERAMAAGFAPAGHWSVPELPRSQDNWHCRPLSVTNWEEAPLRLPSKCTEHPPCCCASSAAARPPPVYPHVEQSPSPMPWPRPADDGEQQQECRSSGASGHPMRGFVELCRSPSKRSPAEKALVPEAANANVRRARSASFGEEVAPGHQRTDGGWERKADVEDGHGVQPLYECRNQNSGKRKSAESAMEDRINEHRQSCRYMPAGQENAAFDQQKRLEFSEPAPEQPQPGSDTKQQECRLSGATAHRMIFLERCRSPSKRTLVEETLVPAAANTIGGEPKLDVDDGHGMQLLYEIRSHGADYSTSETTSSGLKRKLTAATPLMKKQKPLEEWSCTLCQVNMTCQRNLHEHMAGRQHQSNVEALQTRNKPAELNPEAIPDEWSKNSAKNNEHLRRDGKENAAENSGPRQGEKPRGKGNVNVHKPAASRWTCSLCQVKCTCESEYHDHLRGRRHRGNTEALRCAVCDVQCSSEKMLASHLGGRRHPLPVGPYREFGACAKFKIELYWLACPLSNLDGGKEEKIRPLLTVVVASSESPLPTVHLLLLAPFPLAPSSAGTAATRTLPFPRAASPGDRWNSLAEAQPPPRPTRTAAAASPTFRRRTEFRAACAGDAMLVIRDALLSQLQNDRLRQEIIMVELGKIERAMALRSASHQGIASAVAERAEPAPFAFSEQFMTHSRGAVSPERKVGVDEAHDLKKKDGVHGGVELKSKKPAMEDLVRVCLKTSCSNDKAGGQENAALNECKLQKSNETILSKRTSPTVKWSCAICLVEATSQGNLLQHFAGLKHRSNVIALEAEAKAEKSRKVRQYAEKPRPTWNCRFCQADCTCKSDLENHLKGKRHQAKIQALLEECKSMARNSVHWEADSHPNIVPQDEDKPASSTCSICQSTTERTSSGLNRKLTAATPLMKMQKPLGEWSCTLCQVNLTCQRNLHEHLAGRLHQTNVEALQTRNKPAELNAKAIPDEWNKNSAKNSERLCRDGRENVAENSGPQQGEKPRGKDNVNVHKPAEKDRLEPAVSRWTCSLCQAKFTCESDYHDHLRGRRHRENTEALRADAYYCAVCDLQCNGDKMMASHLGGRRHREMLEGHE
ncbi:uncharacterized protein LOC133896959 [Phragmites australis]|uniref:uncharacterized protein LOC133896959 n=1 Tax=Phragmites australis TaxID=29695 RepID=UPI002D783806|nr:uncharacterized protein LOC133896959 [Phragmites australis]